jgi:hypothetical protein
MSSSLRLGKPSVTAFFNKCRSSFGTRHESQGEERTEEIADALPRSLKMTKIKGSFVLDAARILEREYREGGLPCGFIDDG